MIQITSSKSTSCIFSVLIFLHYIQTHAQLEPAYLIPAPLDSSYSVFGLVLKGHVIKTFPNFAGVAQCIMECSINDGCYSLNFYPNTGVCELNSATHLSHPGDYAQSNNGSYLFYFFRRKPTCDDSLCPSDKRCFMGEGGRSRMCKDCSSPLGLEDGTIPDSAMSSTSSYRKPSDPSFRAKYARLNHAYAWAALYKREGEFVQVDLGKTMFVTKIATQGKGGDITKKYVTKYSISWSMNTQTWEDYKENNVVKVFNGNVDRNTVVTNSLKEKIMTRHIRVIVKAWIGNLAMRMELYGCPHH